MGSKPSTPKPAPPPPVPKSADAYAAGEAAMLDARRRSSYRQTFLASPASGGSSLGAGSAGTTSFLGGQ